MILPQLAILKAMIIQYNPSPSTLKQDETGGELIPYDNSLTLNAVSCGVISIHVYKCVQYIIYMYIDMFCACMYVCVCLYVCTYVRMCVRTYICTYVCIRVPVCVSMYGCMHACMHACVNVCVCDPPCPLC